VILEAKKRGLNGRREIGLKKSRTKRQSTSVQRKATLRAEGKSRREGSVKREEWNAEKATRTGPNAEYGKEEKSYLVEHRPKNRQLGTWWTDRRAVRKKGRNRGEKQSQKRRHE